MLKGVFEYIGNIIATMFALCMIFVPLGIWKLVEIIIWCYNHISIGLK